MSESHSKKTLTALVDCAIAQFEESGYEETTIDRIAEAASVSKRTVFRYFRTKEDILLRVHNERFRTFESELRRGSQVDPLDAVFRAASRSFEEIWDDPELHRRRYRLLFGNEPLRRRMCATDLDYQRAIVEYIQSFGRGESLLITEMVAAAGIAGINRVFLTFSEGAERSTCDKELQRVFQAVRRASSGLLAERSRTVVVLAETDLPLNDVASVLEGAGLPTNGPHR